MEVSIITAWFLLSDNVQQVSPFWMECVCRHFESRPKMPKTCCEAVAKAGPVFAEPVYTGTGKYETCPSTCVFNVFVASPDSPVIVSLYL